jgi:hypothetical protein
MCRSQLPFALYYVGSVKAVLVVLYALSLSCGSGDLAVARMGVKLEAIV